MAPADPKPAAPPTEMMTLKVDGKAVSVPKSMPDPVTGRPVPTTMIQACEAAGVDIPHYCYHAKLPVAGNCRMCLVEFGLPALGPDRKPVQNPDGTPRILKQMLPYEPGTPRATIACATPVSPGMEIYTDTPTVRQTRQAVLESLLINHPLDCPICDQAGECRLQEYSLQHGQAVSRFVETKVHKPKQVDLGPRIMLDDERCILCSRCIRFTRDIVGDDALGIVNRGSFNTISTFPGRSFDNNYTLNTVDLCPVGALTSKDFRFQMRVWFLKETRSLCTGCGTGCNVLLGSRENRIYRLTPRENEAVNGPWMCDAGRLNYKWIGRDDRLRACSLRAGGGLAKAAWTDALAYASAKLAGAAPETVAVVASARQSVEELFLVRVLAAKLKAITDVVPRTGEADRLLVSADRNPNTAGARLLGLCESQPGSRLPRIAEAIRQGSVRTLVVLGEDVTRHGLGEELLSRLECLLVLDILPSATTSAAHCVLPGCAHAEKRGSFLNIKGRLQRFWPAVDAPGEALPEWEVLDELVARITGAPRLGSLEAVFGRMASEVPALQGLSWNGLGELGVTVPMPG